MIAFSIKLARKRCVFRRTGRQTLRAEVLSHARRAVVAAVVAQGNLALLPDVAGCALAGRLGGRELDLAS